MTETTAPLPTPLLERHRALGAKIVEFAGWLMPIQYAGILEEHRAVRSAAGLFDLSHMGELVVEGPDAGAALAGALVTDPPSLAVGRAHYSMICAPDGGIIDDLIVYGWPSSASWSWPTRPTRGRCPTRSPSGSPATRRCSTTARSRLDWSQSRDRGRATSSPP
jgi:glycine cleavage system aminomethyltransferase T